MYGQHLPSNIAIKLLFILVLVSSACVTCVFVELPFSHQ